jgi:hypothetical protein
MVRHVGRTPGREYRNPVSAYPLLRRPMRPQGVQGFVWAHAPGAEPGAARPALKPGVGLV